MADLNNPVKKRRGLWAEGELFVWATASALSFTIVTAAILLIVVLINGLSAIWPSDLALLHLEDSSRIMGEIKQTESRPNEDEGLRMQLKIGNRDLYGLDFRWINAAQVEEMRYPEDAVALERMEYGNFYGFLDGLDLEDIDPPASLPQKQAFIEAWEAVKQQEKSLEPLEDEIFHLSSVMQRIRLQMDDLEYKGVEEDAPQMQALEARMAEVRAEFQQRLDRQNQQLQDLRQEQAVFVDAAGTETTIPLIEIVRPYWPNAMGLGDKLGYYMAKLWEILSAEPRESNTEGGLFPAIFGTVILIFIMSIFSFPLGVIAGIYLREYAKQGTMVRLVRIAVNNLAGIPSIVYGIFGLGFFVYGIGGTIDQVFFPERLPTPTFGTGGILWASLTLGLLTVPVVIVSTEEAFGAIPQGIREGSLALGATRFQTLVRTLIPMASPGIMTGFILAMARAAGEVAPLMITGVVKLAPALPVDGEFPYIHLNRKFMHLGFHIYDIGFQSPNAEAAKPMVYVTTMLLVLIVLIMSSLAIYLRNRMRRRFTMSAL